MIKNFFVLLLIGAFILCPLASAVTLEEIKQYATGEGNVTTICYNCTYNATGPKGDPGDPGPAGPAGANASVTINQTRTGDPGSQAQVINLGDLQDLILDFVIPKGDPGEKGDKGDPGLSANVTVNKTFTGDPGTEASVINIGDTVNVSLDVTIPRGYNGTDASINQSAFLMVNGTNAMEADLNAGTHRVINILDPDALTDAATKNYVLISIGNITFPAVDDGKYLWVNGTNVMQASLNAGAFNISNVSDPIATMDAATRNYVDVAVTNGSAVNESYYLRSTTLPLTGASIERNIDSSYLTINGGSGGWLDGSGAAILLSGKTYAAPGAFVVGIPNAAGTASNVLMRADASDTPTLDLQNNDITNVAAIVMDGTGTDSVIYRQTNGSVLRLSAGKEIAGSAGKIELSGNTWSSDTIIFKSWNYAKTADVDVAAFKAASVSADPYLDMKDHDISNVGGISLDGNIQFLGAGQVNSIYKQFGDYALALRGGNATAGTGGQIVLEGADRPTYLGGIYFYVPNAAKSNNIEAMFITGDTNTPALDMSGNGIQSVNDIIMNGSSSSEILQVGTGVRSNGYIAMRGGNLSSGSGGLVAGYGSDYGTTSSQGDVIIAVPNAAANNNLIVLTVNGKTDTPTADFGGYRVTDVGNVTTLGDALPYIPWTAWTPTETWGGGTPASITRVSRYQITGKTCTFSYYISSADSNGATSLKITLPVARASTGAGPALTGIENYGAAGATYANPLPYIAYTDGDIQFLDFKAATDGQRIRVWVSGSYEI